MSVDGRSAAHTVPVTSAGPDRQPPEDPDPQRQSPHHPLQAGHLDLIGVLNRQAFGPNGPSVTGIDDANRGRGAFSVVVRLNLQWEDRPSQRRDRSSDRPDSVVAKLPVDGPNGHAAVTSGAYAREALAYRTILPHSPVTTPTALAVHDVPEGGTALLLQDLTDHRSVDQLDGLDQHDAAQVAARLAIFHGHWASGPSLDRLAVRRNTIAGLAQRGLEDGLTHLETTWADEVSSEQRTAFSRLVRGRSMLSERFDHQSETLCHGDPRADNLVFDTDDSVVLFDWQQMAVQFGEADLAWLAATSLTTDIRRTADRALVEAYGGDLDRYRLGLALPGLAVLFLAQRSLKTERTRRLVAVSLQRIADAVIDFDVAALAS